jgi:DNA replication protein DnaC
MAEVPRVGDWWREREQSIGLRSYPEWFRLNLDVGKTFEAFDERNDERNAYGAVSSWLWEPGKPGLLLQGPVGAGKSHLANAAALELMRQAGWAPWRVSAARIPRADWDAVEYLASVASIPLLVLDDLGKGKHTERLIECVSIIIEGRTDELAPTIVTTNLREDELVGKLGPEEGERVVSRLRELCIWVEVRGDDWRRRI